MHLERMKNMSKEKLLSLLNYESDNGYPSFRNEIARTLHQNYNIESDKADEVVWNDIIVEVILKDIEWSQHMGPNYWAKYILDNYNIDDLPKRTKRLVTH